MQNLFSKIVLAILLTFNFLLFNCSSHQHKKIINPSDYESYLISKNDDKSLENINKDLIFWQNKIKQDSNAIFLAKKANLLAKRFKVSGNINDLLESDRLLEAASLMVKESEVGHLFSLCMNSITQHQFRRALEYTRKTEKIGENKYVTALLASDVQLELGNLKTAKALLSEFDKQNDFNVLLRKAKLTDQEGDLEGAIKLMEQAFENVKANPKNPNYTWALSNLGDMYGHAGRIEDSYKAYLQVLKADKDYLYALKGIAWIAFSNDGNTKEAKRILQYIQSRSFAPDLDLTLAEIAEYEENENEKQRLLLQFKKNVEKPEYGDMYAKYLILLEAEEYKNYQKAIKLAENEVKNRPTVQSYDLLAWSLFLKGEKAKAEKIAREFVENQSSEPEIIYHLGVILNNKALLKEALEAHYELGPIAEKNILEKVRSSKK